MVLIATWLGNLTMGIVRAELHNGFILGHIHREDALAQLINLIIEHARIVETLATVGSFSADNFLSITDTVVVAIVLVFTRQLLLVVRDPTRLDIITRRVATIGFFARLDIVGVITPPPAQDPTAEATGPKTLPTGVPTMETRAVMVDQVWMALHKDPSDVDSPLWDSSLSLHPILITVPRRYFFRPGEDPLGVRSYPISENYLSIRSIKTARLRVSFTVLVVVESTKIIGHAIIACPLPEQYRLYSIDLSTIDMSTIDMSIRSIKAARLRVSFTGLVVVESTKITGQAIIAFPLPEQYRLYSIDLSTTDMSTIDMSIRSIK
ncbi:hypothetical protein N7486_004935 [Penicillium sp. IBT 16267x]|nr:hypothetical protein N7486_004935 [Penicillium sp. IBT 16267x]